jgi:hypothetical protein
MNPEFLIGSARNRGDMADSAGGGPDIAIVVPHTGTVSMRWAIALATLDMPHHHIVTKSTAAIDLARELTVEDALDTNPEWLLFLDSDVIPPQDVFGRLRRHNKPVVSGLYYVDGDVVHPAVWMLDENDSPSAVEVDDSSLIYERDGSASRLEPGADGLMTVDAIGFGCVLIHASVFQEVERPWFRWTKGYDEHPWDLRHQEGTTGISEDFYFCHKLAEAGYDVHLDTSVRCAHEKGCLLTDDGVFLESQLSHD